MGNGTEDSAARDDSPTGILRNNRSTTRRGMPFRDWMASASERVLARLDRACHRGPMVVAIALMIAGIGLTEFTRGQTVWAVFAPGVVCVGLATLSIALRRQRMASVFGLLAIGCTAGLLHHQNTLDPVDDFRRFATSESKPLVFRAEILSPAIWRPNGYFRANDPSSNPWRTQWQVQGLAVRDGQTWKPAKCLSTLNVAGRVHHLLPGDRVTVYGSCALITAPSNPGESDLQSYFASEHQFVFLRAETQEQIELVESTWHRPWSRVLGIVTRHLDRVVHRWVRCGQGSLAAALLFGQRQQVDWEEQQHLLSTGTLHMLAISGMHIELLALALSSACLVVGLTRRKTIGIIGITVVLYGMISGANPPVLRAVFVVLAVCVARWSGRRSSMANLLAMAGVGILVLRTTWIANVGVQLSFLAVATIGIYSGVVDERSTQRRALASVIEETWSWQRRMLVQVGRWAYDLLRISFWVWLMTAPLIWNYFNVVSLVAIPLNVVLWLFLVIGLLSGLALCVLSWLPPVAWMLGWLCGGSLWVISCVVSMGDRLPLAHFWMPSPPLWWSICFYVVAGLGSTVVTFRPRWRKWLGMSLSVWLVAAASPWLVGTHGHGPAWLRWPSLASSPLANRVHDAQELRVTFIDVGHGTSVLLELPNDELMLYDAGHLGSADRSHQEIAGVLWHARTARVDELFLSHADADHYNAVAGLSQRFTLGRITTTPQFLSSHSPEVKQVLSTIRSAGIELNETASPSSRQMDELRMSVLHPPPDWKDTSDNGDSLTLLLEYAGRRILLPGDLEKGGLKRLLALDSVRCDVIMAPHHGSLSHDPEELLRWSSPKWVVVSGGHRAAKRSVEERYTPKGGRVLITHRDGAIQVRVRSDGRLSMWHWRSGWEQVETIVQER